MTTGKLIYNPPPPHECDVYHIARVDDSTSCNIGAIWQCECGRYWLAKRYWTDGSLGWTSSRQRHLRKLARSMPQPPGETYPSPPPYNPDRDLIGHMEAGQEAKRKLAEIEGE